MKIPKEDAVRNFAQFIKEREYLKGSAPKTLSFYCQSFTGYLKHTDGEISQANLNQFVIALKEKGMSTAGANCYIRGMNCFLSWLSEQGLSEPLKIKQLKADFKVMTYLSDKEVKALMSYKPQGATQVRVWTMAMLCLDTGIRVEQCLTLQRSKVDWDNLLITVRGKGAKDRTIPFSLEPRKIQSV